MKLGAIVTVDDPNDATSLANRARDLESAGFESLWTVQAMGRGFMMPDPFVALSVAAAVTTTCELGTAILQLPLYNPTDVALKSYTLSQVSGGRFILGVGAGSTESDYAVHHADFGTRFAEFRTKVSALKETFRTGDASLPLNPWSSAKAGPPVFYGTWGRNVEVAAAEYDGWIASGMHRSPAECAEALAGYRSAGGKRAVVSTIQVGPASDLVELRDRLNAYADAGFDDAVVILLPGAPSLDTVRALVA